VTAPRPSATQVADLLSEATLQLTSFTGEAGLEAHIAHARIQKVGLAAAGFVKRTEKARVQVLGATELEFLESREAAERERISATLCAAGVACLVVCRGLTPPVALHRAAAEAGLALLGTRLSTGTFIEQANVHLMTRFAGSKSLHGVLVDVFGVGLLLLGRSGIGKSECALDLILRGHRLVADDVVEVVRTGAGAVVGMGAELLRHHMEIRGLGIINITDLFGVSAVRDRKRVELVVDLTAWDEEQEYDRLGLDERTYSILGVPIPLLVLPVAPGRNMATILEVAARDRLLKLRGRHSAHEFQERIHQAIAAGRVQSPSAEPSE